MKYCTVFGLVEPSVTLTMAFSLLAEAALRQANGAVVPGPALILPTGYDVIVSPPPGGAARTFTLRILKERP